MKKYNKIAYVFLTAIILLSGFFIYKVSGKNDGDEDTNKKTLAEIHYLEGKFSSLFNQLNNINLQNYKISSSDIEKEGAQSEESDYSANSSKGGLAEEIGNSSDSSGGSGGSGGSSGSGSSGGSDSLQGAGQTSKAQESTKINKNYNLEETGILTKDSQIDWKQIKNEVEKIYVSIYPTTLDLYQTTANQEDIINFNKEYDNLTKAVKDENKELTLKELSLLYEYLPKFVDNCADEEKDKILFRTKNDIFKAYSILDTGDWNAIEIEIKSATQEFTKLVTDVNNQQNSNQYNINKAYIILNELQNAVVLKDKDVFLIKYKNLLEELQNI